MLVKDILATVRPAYCETWDGVLEYFKNNAHEWRRVEELMEEISTRGLLEPGRIDFHDKYEENDELEEYFYLGNGTHRFIATMLLGLEDFPVEYEEKEQPAKPFYRLTEVEIWILKDFIDEIAKNKPDFVLEYFYDCFTSGLNFRVNDECWAELTGSSSTTVGPGVSFNLSFIPIDPEFENEFIAKLVKRISCCIPASAIDYISVGTVRHYDEEFWNLSASS